VEVRLGHPLLDDYLRFVAARCRVNTVLAVGFDLTVFFRFTGLDPVAVQTADVYAFIADQRAPRRLNVVRFADGEAGLSARTVRRRLASLSGLFGYLVAIGAMASNPVPAGMATRRPGRGPRAGLMPLMRTPTTLPRLLSPPQVIALLAALRTRRDTAMVLAMLLGGLRRCEVLGLRLGDLQPGDGRLQITAGKGGYQRIVPIAGRFFVTLASYLDAERAQMRCSDDRVFVVLKGPTTGRGLSAAGLDQVLKGAKARAGLTALTCHMLRHTCLTRLREAGMALEAVQAQAGHRSIESTRIYLHLSRDWLAQEYQQAISVLEAETGTTAGRLT
jgi:integrase